MRFVGVHGSYGGFLAFLTGVVFVAGVPGAARGIDLTTAVVSGGASFEALPPLDPEEPWTFAQGVSGDGSVVVGHSFYERESRAFRWSSETGMERIGPLGKIRSEALAASPDGHRIVGTFWPRPLDWKDRILGAPRAFRWQRGAGLKRLRGPRLHAATAVSADGSVYVGHAHVRFRNSTVAIVWRDGRTRFLFDDEFDSHATDVSDDGSVVVGDFPLGGFRWTEAEGVRSLGAGGASAVSPDGGVVVGPGAGQAYRWTEDEGVVGLGALPSDPGANALDASRFGARIVGASGHFENTRAFLWTEAEGMRELASVLSEAGLDLTGWTLEEAVGISGDGTVIVGNGHDPGGIRRAWRAVLP